MKRSSKGAPPRSFLDWISAEAREFDRKPEFDDLKRPEKDDLRRTLLVEQCFLCVYCGRSLDSDFSDSHIDHFWPQSVFNGSDHPDDRRLEHDNLFQSCGPGSLPGMAERFRHATCGEAKGDWYDEQHFVIPSAPDCEDRFVYDASGRIGAKDPCDRAAVNMIAALKLDHPSLDSERKKVIQDIEQDFLSGRPDWSEVETEIGSSSATDEEGRMVGFAQVARRYLEEERDEHAR